MKQGGIVIENSIFMLSLSDCENVDIVKKIIKTVGRPKNYGLSPEEMEEEIKRKEDERHLQLKQEEAEKELRQRLENDKMTSLLEEWVNLTYVETKPHTFALTLTLQRTRKYSRKMKFSQENSTVFIPIYLLVVKYQYLETTRFIIASSHCVHHIHYCSKIWGQ